MKNPENFPPSQKEGSEAEDLKTKMPAAKKGEILESVARNLKQLEYVLRQCKWAEDEIKKFENATPILNSPQDIRFQNNQDGDLSWRSLNEKRISALLGFYIRYISPLIGKLCYSDNDDKRGCFEELNRRDEFMTNASGRSLYADYDEGSFSPIVEVPYILAGIKEVAENAKKEAEEEYGSILEETRKNNKEKTS